MTCRICGAQLPEGAMFCGECGSSTSATPESRRPADSRPGDTTVFDRAALRAGAGAGGVGAGRNGTGVVSIPVDGFHPIVPPAEPVTAPVRFTFRFSTGERRTVFGTGLVGRNPVAQPGERFDHLVQIGDRTLSVSKTHLEFGEHDGLLWIADRFSGNGTIVRRPDDGALRCEPGRRYLVPRGSRVELASQFFEVE